MCKIIKLRIWCKIKNKRCRCSSDTRMKIFDASKSLKAWHTRKKNTIDLCEMHTDRLFSCQTSFREFTLTVRHQTNKHHTAITHDDVLRQHNIGLVFFFYLVFSFLEFLFLFFFLLFVHFIHDRVQNMTHSQRFNTKKKHVKNPKQNNQNKKKMSVNKLLLT